MVENIGFLIVLVKWKARVLPYPEELPQVEHQMLMKGLSSFLP